MKNITNTVIRIFALLFASAAFASTPIDLGAPTTSTPYDQYMGPVKQVLNHLGNGETPTMDKVRQLMHQGRSFRYAFTTPYTAATPEVTAQTRAGDCKAKALWLCDQLNDPSVRFVIGKARATSKMSHAWVYWQHDSQWYILDCTNLSEPIPAAKVSSRQYIPLYSFSKNGASRYQATQTLLASNSKSAAVGSTGSR